MEKVRRDGSGLLGKICLDLCRSYQFTYVNIHREVLEISSTLYIVY